MRARRIIILAAAAVVPLLAGITLGRAAASRDAAALASTTNLQSQPGLPADATEARARLQSSPRHGEWVVVKSGADSIRAWVVHPERRDNAPVVVVIHEIFGLSHWVRGVADQLAADGFIAIAPDLLTMKNLPNDSTGQPDGQAANAAIRTLAPADVHRYIRAVADFAMKMPSARPVYGVVGYCWGGGASFAHAIASPDLKAAVVYYGTSPPSGELSKIRAPVLGLYAGDDQRVNASIPAADSTMRSLGKTYEINIFEGARHAFLRQQLPPAPAANLEATKKAWPLTVAFFKKHLGA
jgi:carboxymethylenebutenolidase